MFLVLSACATCASWIYYFPELKLGDAARAAPIDKQKEGKKKMRQFGSVEIPREAFIAALKMDAD